MSEKRYNLAKALSWYTIGNLMIKSVNFLTLRLYTELINKSDYGVFGIYQSYLSIFEMIVLLGAAHTIKMVKYDEKIEYDRYFSSVIYIPIVGTILLLALTTLCSAFSPTFFSLDIEIWLCIFLASGMSAVTNLILAKLVLEGMYKAFIIYSFIFTLTNNLLSIFLCLYVFSESTGYWGRIIGNLAALAVGVMYLFRFAKFGKPNFSYIKMGIVYGFPLLVHSVATQLLVQSDKLIINELSPSGAVGIYTVATNIVVIPTTLLSSVEHSWAPWFYEKLSEKDFSYIRKNNNLIVGGFAVILILFILASPEVVGIMTSVEYRESIHVLIPLSMATLAELIYLIPLNVELFYKKNKEIWIFTVIAVVFNVLLDVVFISVFGFLAGAYVTFASRLLLFFMHYLRARRICGESVMNISVSIFAVFILLVTNMFVVWYAQNLILRYSIILIICVFVCLLGKKKGFTVIEIIKKLK